MGRTVRLKCEKCGHAEEYKSGTYLKIEDAADSTKAAKSLPENDKKEMPTVCPKCNGKLIIESLELWD